MRIFTNSNSNIKSNPQKDMKKIVLITGASTGIGRALAEKMLAENFYVIGTSTDGKFPDFDTKNFFPLPLDLSQPKSIDNAHKIIFKEFKRIDILINNAGIGPDLNTIKPERDTFQQTFDVNVTGTVFFTEELICLIKNKGKIINISTKMSSIALCRPADAVAYRMSKTALNMYTKILANRLKDKIRVSAVDPGWVKTTIAARNLIDAPLTPQESAENIYSFVNSDFESGILWGSQHITKLPW